MIVFLELSDISMLNEEYFENKYTLVWESAVLNRKGCVPLTVEPIPKRTVQVHFEGWKRDPQNNQMYSTCIKINRLDSSHDQTARLIIRGLHSNSKVFIQSKTVILMKRDQESFETTVKALFLSSDIYELIVQFDSPSSDLLLYKSPHSISVSSL